MISEFGSARQSPNGSDTIGVSHDEVMAELQRILESPDFETSPRNRTFLKLVVESSLQKRSLRGYDVAVQAFKRPKTFDASKDPIVRIECSKLRKALEVYYLKSGRCNPLRLEIPKGRYSAVFRRNGKHNESAEMHPARIDAKSAALLRAAIAGWAGEKVDGARTWRELQQACPGFPLNGSAAELLRSVRTQDAELHDLLEEGLRRLGQRDVSAAVEMNAAR